MAKVKNHSHGVFTSQSAVRSTPKSDLNRLFFRTTSSAEFYNKHGPHDVRGEDMGNIHYIGMKSTKYMPFPLRQAPNQNRKACWYTHDYCEKPSDSADNRELANTFRPRPTMTGAKSFNNKSHYGHTFPQLSTDEIRAAKLPSQTPYRFEQKKTIGGDVLLETQCHAHFTHKAPPKDLKATGETNKPVDNLELSSKLHKTDNSDMLRTIHRTDFQGKPARGSRDRPGRVSSAPSLMSAASSGLGDEASEISAASDAHRTVRRTIFMGPGK